MQTTKPISRADITGVILAGGRGQRLGGVDKGLMLLHGRPLIEYVLEALRPQVAEMMISANRHRERYAAYALPVVADETGDYAGPLAGMLSALSAAPTPYILTVACDTPSPPADLAARLAAACTAETAACVAIAAGRVQPVFALLRCTSAENLRDYLAAGGREVGDWLRRQNAVAVDFLDNAPAFSGINTPQEFHAAQQRLW
ncbi:MAG: molybdenum cofactor guanylyltransferase [Gammaproteobacteria bacterium]|nr:molybdenum cofactor guanylyltransferase [Gammaproteobacteria bacterium]